MYHQARQDLFRQVSSEPVASEPRDITIELTKAKNKLRRVEEFVRKYETHTDARGFIAGKILEILEDYDA